MESLYANSVSWTPKHVNFGIIKNKVVISSISWDNTPCSPLIVNRRFAGTSRLYHRDRRVGQASGQVPTSFTLVSR
jgi:hypothetical protein